jgi:hypothetical protein
VKLFLVRSSCELSPSMVIALPLSRSPHNLRFLVVICRYGLVSVVGRERIEEVLYAWWNNLTVSNQSFHSDSVVLFAIFFPYFSFLDSNFGRYHKFDK